MTLLGPAKRIVRIATGTEGHHKHCAIAAARWGGRCNCGQMYARKRFADVLVALRETVQGGGR